MGDGSAESANGKERNVTELRLIHVSAGRGAKREEKDQPTANTSVPRKAVWQSSSLKVTSKSITGEEI